jgi:4-diphosphocytidyl-2-C-methyl-D-erythritol kinase
MITLKAPAKLNLTLEVLRKRPDGYHDIRSVIQTVDLCDTLYFQPGSGISIECDMPGWTAEKSLVSKAVALVQEAAGGDKGVGIKIEKRIPLMSGLGGDSSDAAAVLRGLNELWGLGLSQQQLIDITGQLGSDVYFFLYGGTALVEGRGEKVTPLPPLPETWVVLVIPDTPVEAGKTDRMYAALKPEHFTDGHVTEKVVSAIKAGKRQDFSMLFNTFENIAFEDFNIRRVYVEHLEKLGAPHVHLAGSGMALFTMFDDKSGAEDLYVRCKDQGMEAYLTKTKSLRQ